MKSRIHTIYTKGLSGAGIKRQAPDPIGPRTRVLRQEYEKQILKGKSGRIDLSRAPNQKRNVVKTTPEPIKAKQLGSRLLLFDLDDTLIASGGKHSLSRQDMAPTLNESDLIQLKAEQPGFLLGIFTRRPRKVTSEILACAYPNVHWDYIYTYNDGAVKPDCEGIEAAISKFNIVDRDQVFVIGDQYVDIEAAHNAGCKAILVTYAWKSGWKDQTSDDHPVRRSAIRSFPDQVVQTPARLFELLGNPFSGLYPLECLGDPDSIENPRSAIKISIEPDFFDENNKCFILGRFFTSAYSKKSSSHELTNGLLEAKKEGAYPKDWVKILHREIFRTVLTDALPARRRVIISTIPSRGKSTGRMETLLGQLAEVHHRQTYSHPNVEFVPDLLWVEENAPKQRYGSPDNRRKNANNNMRLNNDRALRPITSIEPAVVIIDDIVTTGSTLMRARSILEDTGIHYVELLALAKTVSKYRSNQA